LINRVELDLIGRDRALFVHRAVLQTVRRSTAPATRLNTALSHGSRCKNCRRQACQRQPREQCGKCFHGFYPAASRPLTCCLINCGFVLRTLPTSCKRVITVKTLCVGPVEPIPENVADELQDCKQKTLTIRRRHAGKRGRQMCYDGRKILKILPAFFRCAMSQKDASPASQRRLLSQQRQRHE
jgi:hypothetical protein